MKRHLKDEIRSLGGDPDDAVSQSFVMNGPHGPHFTWSQTRGEPAGHVGLELLRETIAEREDAAPTFIAGLAKVLERALTSDRPNLVRRAVQIVGAMGKVDEEPRILALTAHPDANVAADARACQFVLRRLR